MSTIQTADQTGSAGNHRAGRIVVITGAGGGVGSALVGRFLANGDTVIAGDLSSAALDALRAEHDGSTSLVTVAGSVANEGDVAALADAARAAGGVDILLNVAGFFPFQLFADITPDYWRNIIDINLTGSFLVTSALLPLMSGRGWGRIVNVGSGSQYPGVAGQVHYVSAKTGLIGFTRSLAREVGEEGITVNLLTPGLTLTGPVVENFPPELIAAQREQRALKRDQYAEDLVGPIFFLASPDADFITGQTLNVDGGMFMH
jgi:3-oxoacyl-[acyl-carrier protein] reductase